MNGTKTQPLRVAIVGAGVAGLTTAIGIQKAQKRGANVVFNVYEAAPEFKPIGAGLDLAFNSQRALRLVGAEKAFTSVMDVTDPHTWFEITVGAKDHSASGQRVGKISGTNAGAGRVLRSNFLQEMLDLLPADAVHFGHRCTRYTHSDDGVTLHFANGSSAFANVVVGADGIKSVLRENLYAQSQLEQVAQAPKYSGWVVWRGLIERGRFEEKMGKDYPTKMMRLGQRQHIIQYPIQKGQYINIVAVVLDTSLAGKHAEPWSESGTTEDLLRDFADFNDDSKAVLECVDAPSKWGLFEVPTLSRWSDDTGRVVIVGDAHHGMCPHQGAGAGQAIEDGAFLAALLTAPETLAPSDRVGRSSAIRRAVDVFVSTRKPRAPRAQQTSHEAGLLYEFNGPEGDDVNAIVDSINRRMDWIWYYDIEAGVERALQQLMERTRADQKARRTSSVLQRIEARLKFNSRTHSPAVQHLVEHGMPGVTTTST